MNERIKELMLEAGYAAPELAGRANKFAELIVRECSSMARAFHSHGYDFTGDLELEEFMLKHFGVEE